MFDMMLEQGLNYTLSDKETFDYTSKFKQLQRGKRDKVVNYFMNIKDKTILEELRFC
jgi:DNA-directed RNA polymerase subunit F